MPGNQGDEPSVESLVFSSKKLPCLSECSFPRRRAAVQPLDELKELGELVVVEAGPRVAEELLAVDGRAARAATAVTVIMGGEIIVTGGRRDGAELISQRSAARHMVMRETVDLVDTRHGRKAHWGVAA